MRGFSERTELTPSWFICAAGCWRHKLSSATMFNFINAGGGGVVDAVLGGADIFIVASPINQEPQVLGDAQRYQGNRTAQGEKDCGQ